MKQDNQTDKVDETVLNQEITHLEALNVELEQGINALNNTVKQHKAKLDDEVAKHNDTKAELEKMTGNYEAEKKSHALTKEKFEKLALEFEYEQANLNGRISGLKIKKNKRKQSLMGKINEEKEKLKVRSFSPLLIHNSQCAPGFFNPDQKFRRQNLFWFLL